MRVRSDLRCVKGDSPDIVHRRHNASRITLAEELVEHRAKIDALDDDGKSPLKVAEEADQHQTATLLRDREAQA
jgi:hypothetical protein